MRTSNKILLGTFIVSVLTITGIHVALYAKIKNGDLVVLRSASPSVDHEKHAIPNIKHVLVTGMQECHVIYSDTARLELAKNWKEHLKWSVIGDSLIVEATGPNYVLGERVFAPVDLYLPSDVGIDARFSRIFLRGAADSGKAFSLVVNADHGEVFVGGFYAAGRQKYWKNITINITEGPVTISPDLDIQEATITLNSNAAFSDEGARFGNLTLKVDSTSQVNLRAGSLDKLKTNNP